MRLTPSHRLDPPRSRGRLRRALPPPHAPTRSRTGTRSRTLRSSLRRAGRTRRSSARRSSRERSTTPSTQSPVATTRTCRRRSADPMFSVDAAAATAAYRVGMALAPAQREPLQTQYNASLAAITGSAAAKAGGVAVGESAAAAMLAARAHDGRGSPFTFAFGTTPGAWRTSPPFFAPTRRHGSATSRRSCFRTPQCFARAGRTRSRAVRTPRTSKK